MPPSVSLKTNQRIGPPLSEFAWDVCAGLSKPQKELHSKYLYDQVGSALFDAITLLPEYGLTRADERLLSAHAHDIVARVARPLQVIELGSGNGRKTRHVLSAIRSLQREIEYFPIDISPEALARCVNELSDLAAIRPLMCTYLEGVTEAVAHRGRNRNILVLFLGSTIGNFERPCALAFLRDLRRKLNSGDALLIGADLVKPERQLLLAYDDPLGVTAAFNLNLLGRVNRELGADFDLSRFRHEARYNHTEQRVEMHLKSICEQTVSIRSIQRAFTFAAGDTIWTESSHKYEPVELDAMAENTGWVPAARWVDQDWPFAEALWIAR